MGDIYSETTETVIHESMKEIAKKVVEFRKVAASRITVWMKRLQNSTTAFDEFRGADKVMLASARLHACECVMVRVREGMDKDSIKDWLQKTLNNEARFPIFTTSPCENIMHTLQCSAWAQILEYF